MSCHHYEQIHSRRDFLAKAGLGLGAAALAHLFRGNVFASPHVALPGGGIGGEFGGVDIGR